MRACGPDPARRLALSVQRATPELEISRVESPRSEASFPRAVSVTTIVSSVTGLQMLAFEDENCSCWGHDQTTCGNHRRAAPTACICTLGLVSSYGALFSATSASSTRPFRAIAFVTRAGSCGWIALRRQGNHARRRSRTSAKPRTGSRDRGYRRDCFDARARSRRSHRKWG
jgi:hypothetical protein